MWLPYHPDSLHFAIIVSGYYFWQYWGKFTYFSFELVYRESLLIFTNRRHQFFGFLSEVDQAGDLRFINGYLVLQFE